MRANGWLAPLLLCGLVGGLLGLGPIDDDARIGRLEGESLTRLRALSAGCERFELHIAQQGRVGALRRSSVTWTVQAELRSGSWRLWDWERTHRRGDLAGYDDWPFVMPGAGSRPGGQTAVMGVAGAFDWPVVLSAAVDREGGAVLEQRMVLSSAAGEARVLLTTFFDEADRARRWVGEARGPLPYEGPPLEDLRWSFEVDEVGRPLRETLRTSVPLSTARVRIRLETDFTPLGACE